MIDESVDLKEVLFDQSDRMIQPLQDDTILLCYCTEFKAIIHEALNLKGVVYCKLNCVDQPLVLGSMSTYQNFSPATTHRRTLPII